MGEAEIGCVSSPGDIVGASGPQRCRGPSLHPANMLSITQRLPDGSPGCWVLPLPGVQLPDVPQFPKPKPSPTVAPLPRLCPPLPLSRGTQMRVGHPQHPCAPKGATKFLLCIEQGGGIAATTPQHPGFPLPRRTQAVAFPVTLPVSVSTGEWELGARGGPQRRRPQPTGWGKGPCWAARPEPCESADISYRALQQLPLLACGRSARCTQGKWWPGRLPSALHRV